MFKFSLRLCIWLALLVGSVLGLVLDREPWVLDTKVNSLDDIASGRLFSPGKVLRLRYQNYQAPDEVRKFGLKGDVPLVEIMRTHETLCLLPFSISNSSPVGFMTDDLFLVQDGKVGFILLRRRFPEWWWGIFYRPLFWIAVVVLFGTVFEFVSMRKRLRS